MCPDVFERQTYSVAKAKKAISDYRKAVGAPQGLAELMTLYCEAASSFCTSVGVDDEGFYDALVRMFEQTLKSVAKLDPSARPPFLERLEKVCDRSRVFGWGAGDAIDDLRAESPSPRPKARSRWPTGTTSLFHFHRLPRFPDGHVPFLSTQSLALTSDATAQDCLPGEHHGSTDPAHYDALSQSLEAVTQAIIERIVPIHDKRMLVAMYPKGPVIPNDRRRISARSHRRAVHAHGEGQKRIVDSGVSGRVLKDSPRQPLARRNRYYVILVMPRTTKTGFDKFFDEQMAKPSFEKDYKQARSDIDAIDQIVRALDSAREQLGLTKADLARAISAKPDVVLQAVHRRSPEPHALDGGQGRHRARLQAGVGARAKEATHDAPERPS